MNRLVFTTLLFVSLSGFAGKLDGDSWLAGLNYGLNKNEVNSGSGGSTTDMTSMDITVGFTRSNNLYLGVIYGSTSGDSPGGSISATQMGPSIGYVSNGWVLIAHYLLGGTYSNGSTKYKEGTGTQFDLGHLFKTSSSIFVGFQITSRQIKYKDDAEVTDLYPAFKAAYFW